MRVVHAVGKRVTFEERKDRPYLSGKLFAHTKCGYLFDSVTENRGRLSIDASKANCKRCTKLIEVNNQKN